MDDSDLWSFKRRLIKTIYEYTLAQKTIRSPIPDLATDAEIVDKVFKADPSLAERRGEVPGPTRTNGAPIAGMGY